MRDIWDTLKEWCAAAWFNLQALSGWTENRQGLGTWIGAAGAIIAILAAWGLARTEYNRVKRVEATRFNSEITLYQRITAESLALAQQYIALAEGQEVAGGLDRLSQELHNIFNGKAGCRC